MKGGVYRMLTSFHNNIFNVQFTIYKVQFNYADDSAAKLYFVNGKL